MQKWILNLIISALGDPKVQSVLKNLLWELVGEKILPILPALIGTAVKGAIDGLVEKIPGLDGAVDATAVVGDVRETLGRVVPDFDFGIKAVDDILDAWRPKG